MARTVERDRALGVSNPNTPVWTRERIEPSIKEAAVAGKKIMAVNGNASHAIAAIDTPQLEQSSLSDNSRLDKHLIDRQEETSERTIQAPEFISGVTSSPWQDELSSVSDQPHEETATKEPAPTLRELLIQKLGDRNLKGFVKAMPKVSKSEVEAIDSQKTKTKISQMSIAEINDYLSDPILRKQIVPQLWHSSHRLITDELGEVIAVEPSVEEEQT